jgi:hypothetical protein
VAPAASPEPWRIRLDAGADAYVATLRSPGIGEPHLIVHLPRRLVDEAVLTSAGIALELTPEARVAAHAENTARTLAATTLRTLIAQAVAPESFSEEEASVALNRLEEELRHGLEIVRQVRASRQR